MGLRAPSSIFPAKRIATSKPQLHTSVRPVRPNSSGTEQEKTRALFGNLERFALGPRSDRSNLLF